MKFNYTAGKTPNAEIKAGEYKVMITRAEIANIKGYDKLVVDFTLENGEVRTEFIRLESWIQIFIDLLEASGQEFDRVEGEFDTDYLIGLEGTLVMVENAGKGQHEGKVFINADRFLSEKKS